MVNVSFRLYHLKISLGIAMLLILWGCVLSESEPVTDVAEPSESSPNVVVIVADDLGWNDIGYHGSMVETPNLDRLAEGGVRLNQFYAYSTCSPSRVALLTGQSPALFKVFGPLGSTTDVRPADMLLPFGLQESHYSTHISGKWHIGDTPDHRPLDHGFTTSYGYLRGQIDPYTHRYKYGDYVTWHRNDQFIEEDGHVTDLITDEAIRVIEKASEEKDAPFFLYVAHHAPHYPHNSPPKWIEPYDDVFDDIWRRHNAAVITHMDHEIGRIVDALEKSGQRDNTLIIFMSDNGGQKGWGAPDAEYNGKYAAHTKLGDNTPLRGWKTDLYEGGIRVPALVNWPSVIPAGGEINNPTHILDWAPTILQITNPDNPLPEKLEGKNLWPIIAGEKSETTLAGRRLFWRQSGLRTVRDGDWKLIAHGDDLSEPELFHLAENPYEDQELGREYPEKKEQLLELLQQWRGHNP